MVSVLSSVKTIILLFQNNNDNIIGNDESVRNSVIARVRNSKSLFHPISQTYVTFAGDLDFVLNSECPQ